jgi:hypothetical protein
MEMDDKTLDRLREMEPRAAYAAIKTAVLASPGGSSSEDLQAAFDQVVEAGILTWDEIESFEEA